MQGEIRLPLAPNGIFHTIQGEGALLGEPSVFVRLAGCSVGCHECDTDYSVAERLTPKEIAERVASLCTTSTSWVWVTGGEPTDHRESLDLLQTSLWRTGLRLALATSGVRKVRLREDGGWDFVSVSPHDMTRWVQKEGSQLNIVPGLNGLKMEDILENLSPAIEESFTYKYATPLYGSSASLKECVDFISVRHMWRLGIQAHKVWGVK